MKRQGWQWMWKGLATAGLLLAHALAGAAGQPPLTLIVPAAAGSAPDIVARLLGEELQTRLGQAVIVDNKPGAGGIVAVMAAKRGPAEGVTLLLAHAAVATVTPLTYRAARYDLAQDFEPVSVVADTPMLFVTGSSGPASLAELLGAARAKPDSVSLGSTVRGSIPHLAGVLLGQSASAQFNIVPMSTSGQAIQAVVSGATQVSVDGVAPLLPLVRAGRLKALAVTSDRVLPGLEGLPLARDTVPALDLTGWFMLFAPKGTPAARVKRLNEAVDAAMRDPEVARRLQATANYPVGGSVEHARSFLAREKRKWAEAVQRAGLQPE